MKNIFTLLAVFCLQLTAAGAQNVVMAGKTAPPPQKFTISENMGPAVSRAAASPEKIVLDDGERLAGFYTTDDLPDMTYGGYGITFAPGQLRAGVVFADDVLGKYAGAEITKVRFALAAPAAVSGLYIYEVTTGYEISGEPVSYTDLSSISATAGWNDVTLPSPVTIDKDKYYLIAYEYTQLSDPYSIGSFPLATDKTLDVDTTTDYGFLVYGDWASYLGGDDEPDWLNMGSGNGALCIQAVIGGADLPDDDISLGSLSAPAYAKTGETLSYSFSIRSEGNLLPSSYTLETSIDGTPAGELDTPVALSDRKQRVESTVTIPSGMTTGTHTLAVRVTSINGAVPERNTGDDTAEAAFTAYADTVARQMHLIEQFTSVRCTWCPLGHDVLEAMRKLRPGKYAWVSIHCAGMGSDPFYLSDGSTDYIEDFAMPSGSSYPSAAFDRYLFDDENLASGEIAVSIGYKAAYTQMAAEMIDDMVNGVYDGIPAFATVGIDTGYDDGTRLLSIRVYGEGGPGTEEVLSGNRLTVYLTEDSLVSAQLNQGVNDTEYVHNNVLRAIVTEQGFPYCGDEINWTSDRTYENDYTVTLGDGWNAGNMHVVAFLSRSFAVDTTGTGSWAYSDYDDGFVNNANMTGVGGTTQGIGNPGAGAGACEISRYTPGGIRLERPVRGVNIVRMSDGSVRKVLVR